MRASNTIKNTDGSITGHVNLLSSVDIENIQIAASSFSTHEASVSQLSVCKNSLPIIISSEEPASPANGDIWISPTVPKLISQVTKNISTSDTRGKLTYTCTLDNAVPNTKVTITCSINSATIEFFETDFSTYSILATDVSSGSFTLGGGLSESRTTTTRTLDSTNHTYTVLIAPKEYYSANFGYTLELTIGSDVTTVPSITFTINDSYSVIGSFTITYQAYS